MARRIRQPVSKVARCILYIPTRIHYTRANVKTKMEGLEQENQALRAEVTTMKTKMEEVTAMKTQMEELTELVKVLSTAQNPPPPPPPVRT